MQKGVAQLNLFDDNAPRAGSERLIAEVGVKRHVADMKELRKVVMGMVGAKN